MTTILKKPSNEKLQKILDIINEKFPAVNSELIKNFTQYFYQSITSEETPEWGDVANFYGAAITYWHLIHQYNNSQSAKIRVYNPQFEQDGWQTKHTIISILVKNKPFLVDSIHIALNRQGFIVYFTNHLIFKTVRNQQDELLEILASENNTQTATPYNHESIIHLEIDRQTEPQTLEKIARELKQILNDVHLATYDWQAMRREMEEVQQDLATNPPPIDKQEIKEVNHFLQWLQTNNFIFFGYQEYQLSTTGELLLYKQPHTGLGILRENKAISSPNDNQAKKVASKSFAKLPLDLRQLAQQKTLVSVHKTVSYSTIHRPGYLDYIGIKLINAEGIVTGEKRFLGLYTSAAYHQLTQDIPIIRYKIKYVLEKSGFSNINYLNRALSYVLETYPRDELFWIDKDFLFHTAMGILKLNECQQRVRLFILPDVYLRFFSCLVYMPRERYDTNIRQQIQSVLLNAFSGIKVDFNVRLSESALAQIHFIVHIDAKNRVKYDIKTIENQLIEVTRTWSEILRETLLEHNGEELGIQLFSKYETAFSAAYKEDFSARHAIYDIEKIEHLSLNNNDLAMNLYRPIEVSDNFLQFKLFHAQNYLSLSKILHKLENMGVKVTSERSYKIQVPNKPNIWIQDFGLQHKQASLKISEIKETFQELFKQVWLESVENDGFNRLILHSNLNWREIIIFRAYWKYLRQIKANFSQEYVEQALVNNPVIITLLRDLFHARFQPSQEHTDNIEKITQQLETALDSVVSLDEDRILRLFFGMISATLRTNYFQLDLNGQPKSYLSFKIAPHQVAEMPEPRPMFEIFVYSPQVEGVHLRGGKVARGGIRWSDRIEDFRTEILGLVKAQMVKNAVIVPVGSKGGFIAKRMPKNAKRELIQAEGIACYKTFICGLLDLTDNLLNGKLISPKNVVRYDEDDPYLVVAADKGTATFSDIANEISQSYKFWLGDAFASGGSTGYDHKKIGITARGAWESVKRHFRELNIDIHKQDFSVIGIGDMSGDVFGNGMLLSQHIKLLGAFNHLHIFLDPNPNSQTSFQERQRLFQLPRSSWIDYNARLISKGGGVFSRNLKQIHLSSEVRNILGINQQSLTPTELIKTMLKTSVDLLWNGGIGTYVKAESEQQIEIGDRNNDAVRINANELRCKIVAEGGNLGFSQLGRIEYALHGGRIYSDAMDNSGGVDCSDHEVNIKILLDAVVNNGDMTGKQRNQLLVDMTDSVAYSVLKNNYLQTQAINASLSIAPQLLDLHSRFIRFLEKIGQLDRDLEFLPSNKILIKRRADKQGLTAPELCVLQAYAKINLYKTLLHSDLLKEPYFIKILEQYFPSTLTTRFSNFIEHHHLNQEIIATELTNLLFSNVGIAFIFMLHEETGQSIQSIVKAFMVAWEVFDIKAIFEDIQALDNTIDAQVQIQLMLTARQQIERAARWLLRHYQVLTDMQATITMISSGVHNLSANMLSLIGDTEQAVLKENIANFTQLGVPNKLAMKVARLVFLLPVFDIVEVTNNTAIKLEKVAAVYFLLGTQLELYWLRDHIAKLPRDNRWTALSRSALRDELYRTHRELTMVILKEESVDLTPKEQIATWMDSKKMQRYQQILADVNRVKKPDLSMLLVALREVRNLL
ncbi:MAG: NAD-glutamate dehydrogenase [Thiomargarita sp.]|nr:NAD-glutamate dehydrogenase [Thiomargarita sp.]